MVYNELIDGCNVGLYGFGDSTLIEDEYLENYKFAEIKKWIEGHYVPSARSRKRTGGIRQFIERDTHLYVPDGLCILAFHKLGFKVKHEKNFKRKNLSGLVYCKSKMN